MRMFRQDSHLLLTPLVSNASSTADDLPHQNVFHSKFPVGVIAGLPRRKFNSRLPVSYGIPLPVVQQLGSPLVSLFLQLLT
ncbi:hypothetical protein OIU76_007107 [Salix suchowensis]|nr:hypothetical protein OIU78_012353 [Salix suchowensis]KAJ6337367.1 hypothetical protein OIU76_007107 [Salix suchowensis]